jgi:hypothetical protein
VLCIHVTSLKGRDTIKNVVRSNVAGRSVTPAGSNPQRDPKAYLVVQACLNFRLIGRAEDIQ